MTQRPRYYAINSRDNVIARDRRTIRIENARLRAQPPSLAREGFALFPQKSALSDFRDSEEIARLYVPEMERMLAEVCGADHVAIYGPLVHRYSDRSLEFGQLNILRPARFAHVDLNDSMAALYSERCRPKDRIGPVRRAAHYNLWRVLSPPPQDIPLAVCDSRTVAPSDLVDADSILDVPGSPEPSRVVVCVRYSPRHCWSYFPDMNQDEVLVFKSHDTDPAQPRFVPHSAFTDRSCPPGAAPRASIEARAVAFWFG